MVDIGKDRMRSVWAVVGVVFALVLLFILFSFVGTFVFALFIYYATRPGYRRLRARVGSPSLAAALALLLLALPAVVLLGYTLAIALQEFSRFAATTDLGAYERVIQPYLDLSAIVDDPASLLMDPNLTDTIRQVLDEAVLYVGLVAIGLLHLFVMFALAFYMLRDGPRLARWFQGQFADDQGVLEAYLRAVDADLHKVFSGNIYNAIITAVIGAIVYSLLNYVAPSGTGVPYPALLGLLAGAASLIPVVGMKLVYIPVTAYLFGATLVADEPVLWFPALFAIVSFIVVDTIPDLVLRPYVSGRNLHVGMVMFAYIFGPLLFGWYGIFLGPVILVLFVHFVRLVLPELVDGTPIQPFAVDPGQLAVLYDPAPPSDVDAPDFSGGVRGGSDPSSGTSDGDADDQR